MIIACKICGKPFWSSVGSRARYCHAQGCRAERLRRQKRARRKTDRVQRPPTCAACGCPAHEGEICWSVLR